uniref:Protein Flattop n=1 Tax=Apteryx owenii TaxID=8824 RepID=A0A8B9NYQ0_APTOW
GWQNYSRCRQRCLYRPCFISLSPNRIETKSHPLPRDGYTQIIADDRGHLLPSVPRSKASPWGTFLGTWDMPLKIPPARLSLTSRSAASAAQLTDWIHESTTLTSACNGLRPEITGKVAFLHPLAASADQPLPVCRGFSPPHEPSEEPSPAANPARGSRPPWVSPNPSCHSISILPVLPFASPFSRYPHIPIFAT